MSDAAFDLRKMLEKPESSAQKEKRQSIMYWEIEVLGVGLAH